MRRWLSFMTIFALLLCINGYHKELEPCPENTVCIFFGNDKCKVRGVEKTSGGYVWNANTTCTHQNYGYVYARLDIRPISPTKWKVNATLYEKEDGKIKRKPKDYLFKFHEAELTFPDVITSQFLWSHGGVFEKSVHEMTKLDTFKTQDSGVFSQPVYEFNRYSFEISAGGNNLIDYFGAEAELQLNGVKHGFLNDSAFPELLSGITPQSFEAAGMSAQSKAMLGVGIGVGVLVLIIAAIFIVWFLHKRRTNEPKFTVRDSDSKAQTPGGMSTHRDSTPAIAPAYTPPAPYESANPYEVPVPPVPK